MCKETEPVGAECRVFNKTLPIQIADSGIATCGVNGLQCTNTNSNNCEDYEIRYRCSAQEGMYLCQFPSFCKTTVPIGMKLVRNIHCVLIIKK